MLNVAHVDRRTGQDWPYTEKEMRQAAAQRDYPPAGRSAAHPRRRADGAHDSAAA